MTYQWSQEDHTPDIDNLANELGAEQAYRAGLVRCLKPYANDLTNPVAQEILKDMAERDVVIAELEQAIKEAQNDYIKAHL